MCLKKCNGLKGVQKSDKFFFCWHNCLTKADTETGHFLNKIEYIFQKRGVFIYLKNDAT